MTITQSDNDEVREIQAGTAPTRFARGWHCIGLTESFKDGQPHSIEAFGTKLVVFADSEGNVKILDAYCRHMGGDLSRAPSRATPLPVRSTIGAGAATASARRFRTHAASPPAGQDARLANPRPRRHALRLARPPRGQPADRRRGYPPRIEGALSDEWSDWVWYTTTVDTNCREIVDNIVDMAHFFYVHYSFPTYFKNVFEGHAATQYMRGVARSDMRPPRSRHPEDGRQQLGCHVLRPPPSWSTT